MIVMTTMAGRLPMVIQLRHADRKRSPQQREKKFVDLVVGGLAVIAGDAGVHVGGDDSPLQGFQLGQKGFGHGHAVGTLFLGHRDGHRGGPVGHRTILDRRRPAEVVHHAGRLCGIVYHVRHVRHIDRIALAGRHHEPAYLVGRPQKVS